MGRSIEDYGEICLMSHREYTSEGAAYARLTENHALQTALPFIEALNKVYGKDFTIVRTRENCSGTDNGFFGDLFVISKSLVGQLRSYMTRSFSEYSEWVKNHAVLIIDLKTRENQHNDTDVSGRGTVTPFSGCSIRQYRFDYYVFPFRDKGSKDDDFDILDDRCLCFKVSDITDPMVNDNLIPSKTPGGDPYYWGDMLLNYLIPVTFKELLESLYR